MCRRGKATVTANMHANSSIIIQLYDSRRKPAVYYQSCDNNTDQGSRLTQGI